MKAALFLGVHAAAAWGIAEKDTNNNHNNSIDNTQWKSWERNTLKKGERRGFRDFRLPIAYLKTTSHPIHVDHLVNERGFGRGKDCPYSTRRYQGARSCDLIYLFIIMALASAVYVVELIGIFFYYLPYCRVFPSSSEHLFHSLSMINKSSSSEDHQLLFLLLLCVFFYYHYYYILLLILLCSTTTALLRV